MTGNGVWYAGSYLNGESFGEGGDYNLRLYSGQTTGRTFPATYTVSDIGERSRIFKFLNNDDNSLISQTGTLTYTILPYGYVN